MSKDVEQVVSKGMEPIVGKDVEQIVRELLAQSKNIYVRLSEMGAPKVLKGLEILERYRVLEKYVDTPFSDMEIEAINKGKITMFDSIGIDLEDMLGEVGLRYNFLMELFKKGVIDNETYFTVSCNLILLDVEIREDERPLIPLILRMSNQGLLDYNDFPYQFIDGDDDTDNEELKKEIPLASYDRSNCSYIVCVSGFCDLDYIKGIMGHKQCDVLIERGIDWYHIAQALVLYGCYIYPCKTAAETLQVMVALKAMAITYIGVPN